MEKILLPRCYVCSGFPHRTGLDWVFAKRFTQDTIALGLRLGHQKNVETPTGHHYHLFPLFILSSSFSPNTDYIPVRILLNLRTRLQLGRIKKLSPFAVSIAEKRSLESAANTPSPLLKPKRRPLGMKSQLAKST